MYSSHYEIANNQLVDGVKIKISHQDDSMLMTEFTLPKGVFLPEHIHLSDHSAYLLKGKIRLIADGVVSDFFQGDSWCIGKNICHYTEALDDSVILEVFSSENEGFHQNQFADESELVFET